MKLVFKTFNLNLSVLTLICIFASNVQAQIKMFPLDNLTDGYLELQENKVPIFESLQDGNVCLFDYNWCYSDDPELPSAFIYEGGFDSNQLLAIIDSQLVLIEKGTLSISNGFLKLRNINSEVDNTVFKMFGYSQADDLLKLTSLPLETYAVKKTHTQESYNFVLSEENDNSEEVTISYGGDIKWIDRTDALKLLQEQLLADEFGMVWVMVDGVLIYMSKSSLRGLINATRAIVVSV